MEASYSYTTEIFDNGRQYSAEEMESGVPVDARYVKMWGFEGNPYIEALPRGYSMAELRDVYNVSVDVPTQEELQTMDEIEINDSVDRLSDFRILLPFHAMIEKQFHRTPVQSYRKRRVQENERVDVDLTVENQNIVTHSQMLPKCMSDPVPGFTLLGAGGCGKSTGINMMLKHYPQTIIHNRDSWNRRVQIVYLLVHCTPNSNFSQLYENIGEAIDKALDNFQPVYQLQFRRGHLGDKYNLLKQLIRKFAIGAIILDEIELLDLKSTKESSFETFMALSNETGVSVCVVGTLDAYEKLFGKERTARRCGVNIIASRYCANQNTFRAILKFLQIYHWTPKMVDFADTPELWQAMYKVTHGVISDIVSLYAVIQEDQVKCLYQPGKKPAEITSEYIENLGKKYFSILMNARAIEDDTVEDGNSLSLDEVERLNSAQDRMDEEEMNERYQETIKDPATMKYALLQQSVVEAISAGHYGYRRSSIEKAFLVIMHRPDASLDMPVDEAVKKVLLYLEQKRKKQEEKQLKKERENQAVEEMQDELRKNNADAED